MSQPLIAQPIRENQFQTQFCMLARSSGGGGVDSLSCGLNVLCVCVCVCARLCCVCVCVCVFMSGRVDDGVVQACTKGAPFLQSEASG